MGIAQEGVLGPYVPDANTVLLMHFDSEADLLKNDATVAGVVDGEARGALQFLPAAAGVGGLFGGAMYLQNDTPADTNHAIVPEYAALDLTGSFTLEGWFQPTAYTSAGNGFWSQRHPSIIRKGVGNRLANNNNYQVVWNGDNRGLYGMAKYANAQWNSWFEARSDDNIIEIFKWYHFAVIRDTASDNVAILIHNQAGELISSVVGEDLNHVQGFELEVNDFPFQIGSEPNWNDITPAFFNGMVDEIRVSNIARVYQVPVGINKVFGNNIEPGENPEIIVQIAIAPGNDIVGTPMVHYSCDDCGTFVPIATAPTGNTNEFNVTLPVDGVFGDQVYYYVTTENTFGQINTIPATATSGSNNIGDYYGVGFWNEDELVLSLSFEEGQGNPVDASAYGNDVFLRGEACEYAMDVPAALAGTSTYSMAINMNLNVAAPETAYVEVPAPAMWVNGQYQEGWTVDFWAKIEGVPWADREDGQGQIWLWDGGVSTNFNNVGDFRVANYQGPQYWSRIAGVTELQVGIPEAHFDFWGKWYHYVQTATDDTMYLWVYDENNEMISSGVAPYPATGVWNPQNNAYIRLGHTEEPLDKLRGYIDEFKFYNYPAIFDDQYEFPEQDPRGDLAINGFFEDNTDGWESYGTNVNWEQDGTDPISGDFSCRIDLGELDGTNWHHQWRHRVFPAWDGMRYLVSFKAKASVDQTVELWVQQNGGAYAAFAIENINLTTTAQGFSFTSDVIPEGVNDIYIGLFCGGGVSNSQIWVDDFVVIEAREMITNGDFEDAASLDSWTMVDHSGASEFELALDETGALSGNNSAHITLTGTSGTNWHLQFHQQIMTEEDFAFMISFDAVADQDVSIENWIQQDGRDYAAYATTPFTIGTTPMTYRHNSSVFGMDETVLNTFFLGAAETPRELWLDNISVLKVPEAVVTGVGPSKRNGLPSRFELAQNYPNPFNPTTTIGYALPTADHVTLKVFDMLGRQIATLIDGQRPAGHHQVVWDANDRFGQPVASGIYIYQLTTNGKSFNQTRKMLLVR